MFEPTTSVDVGPKLALPATRLTGPCGTPSTENVTVPVGGPVPSEATVAVKVTGCPKTGEATLLDSVVVVFAANVAVAESAAVMVTWHEVFDPEHAPDHPTNVDVDAGVAVNVTPVPFGYEALQVVPQLMVFDPPVTVPDPGPALETVSDRCRSVKVAVTDRAWVIVTVHDPVPLQRPPDHPVKLDEPGSALAVKVTLVP